MTITTTPEVTGDPASAGSGGATSDVNLKQINGVTPSVGNGTVDTGTLRVDLASNGTGQVAISQVTPGTTNAVDLKTVAGGTAIAANNGAASAGTIRVTVASDSTGQIKLAAGSALIGSVSTDLTTPGTSNQVSAGGYKVRTVITRPANTTPYSANDVVGGALDLGVLGPATASVMITSVDLIHEVTAIPSGMTSFRIYLYSATPPSAVADNGAFDLAAGDLSVYIGYVDLGIIADLGSNLYVQIDNVLKHVVTGAAGHLFAYLVTNGAWTPGANSTVFDLTMRTMGV